MCSDAATKVLVYTLFGCVPLETCEQVKSSVRKEQTRLKTFFANKDFVTSKESSPDRLMHERSRCILDLIFLV